MTHGLMNLSVAYGQIWHRLYQTYPTKKDFMEFLNRFNVNIEAPVTLDRPMFEKILNSFVIKTAPIEELHRIYSQTMQIHKESYIIDKLKYRYAVVLADVGNGENLIVRVMKIKQAALEDDLEELIDAQKNPICGSINESNSFCDDDYLYMNEYEKRQYIVYKDLHFLLKILDNTVIYMDCSVNEQMIRLISQASEKPVMYLYGLNCLSCLSSLNAATSFQISKELYHILPCIASTHITISEHDSPTVKPLSMQIEKSFFYQRGKLPVPSSKSYAHGKCIVNDITDTRQHTYTYIIPELSHNALVCSDEFVKKLWSEHIIHPCPIKTNDPRHGILLYYDWLVRFCFKNNIGMKYSGPGSSPLDKNVVVIVDNRPNILSVISIIISINILNLENGWTWEIHTSSKAVQYYVEWMHRFNVQNIVKVLQKEALNGPKFNIDVYNYYLMGTELWDSLHAKGYEKCLIIQDDGILFRRGIEKFMKFDYVGAPWIDAPGNEYLKICNPDLVGNGGLSLRSIDKMRNIVHKFKNEKKILHYNNMCNIPEDVYFCKHLKLPETNSVMPTQLEASFFSNEEIINPESIGFHKVWSYHHPLAVRNWLMSTLD